MSSVSTVLLQMKIPQITLDSRDRRYAELAVGEIEVTAIEYAKQRGLLYELAPSPLRTIVGPFREGPTRLPAVMRNITVDDALDAVARAFKGVVTYGACIAPDRTTLFDVGYERGPAT